MRLAVIPARGGSKRIPRKNIKSFLTVSQRSLMSLNMHSLSKCLTILLYPQGMMNFVIVARHHCREVHLCLRLSWPTTDAPV